MNFQLNPRLYKKGDRVYDPETKSYQTVTKVRSMKIHGAWRHFIQLGAGKDQSPDARWREQHDVYSSKPKDSDYGDLLN